MFVAASVFSSRMTYFTVASGYLGVVFPDASLASLHPFHERGAVVSDTAAQYFQTFRPLAVSLASTVRTAS
jgi:hypothetical protein